MANPQERDPLTPNDEPDRLDVLDDRPLYEQLGVKAHFLPDDESPPVDEARLLAFVRKQLSPEERDEIIYYLATYRPWLKAWADILRREKFPGKKA